MKMRSAFLLCALMCVPTHTEARDFVTHDVVACWSEAAVRSVVEGYRKLAHETGAKDTNHVRPFVRGAACKYLQPALFKPSKLIELWSFDALESSDIVFGSQRHEIRVVVDTALTPSTYFLLIGQHVAP